MIEYHLEVVEAWLRGDELEEDQLRDAVIWLAERERNQQAIAEIMDRLMCMPLEDTHKLEELLMSLPRHDFGDEGIMGQIEI